MNLQELKEKILDRYNTQPNDIVISKNKRGSERLVIKYALICYYDQQNDMFYGETQHWWLNNTVRYKFYLPSDQINWLFKRLDKLDNHLFKREVRSLTNGTNP